MSDFLREKHSEIKKQARVSIMNSYLSPVRKSSPDINADVHVQFMV